MTTFLSWGPVALMTLLIFYGLFLYPYIRILRRTGHSGWWVLALLIPGVNLVAIWIFAFVEWPALDRK
ncbi:hypothetical protein EFP18_26450 [Burkholderia glumae]|uniref:DUF805 domain-containing protein n=2 Tax=Burkholderia glumae TaxID=337 RepID=A0AAP9XY35_BURGL|nr:hypothetical protein [Burkholderia glumae]ACR32124.1 Hypothetical protein bglu_2g17890 [Burkholderia glumae BGR1]MCM2484694.1 DUF805 domain-containing protein [Burkholderia glumae]MCM2495076.1 DUF805 domain-containing protein [Burkholderia glumae]MCM2510387.1 DUF805 domain-containing protein [Burkholderia glumae]MCM2540154.1 DUF805 domain-containing protein [Burkholderia glumae]